jgi:hypothetical protein
MAETPENDYVPAHKGPEKNTSSGLSNKMYDRLKVIALVWLPALGGAYFSLAGVWDLPKVNEVVGTVTILDTFLGVILGISNQKHKNDPNRFAGAVEYKDVPGEDEPGVNLRLKQDMAELEGEKEITFKILPR